MKILSNLTATSIEAPEPPAAVRQGMNLEPVPGFFLNIAICDDGLRVRTNKDTVHIPLQELLDLAQKHHPKLVPHKAK